MAAWLILWAGAFPSARAQDAPGLLQRVEVIGSTPLGADGVPLTKTPANAQTLRASDIREQGASNLADLLNDNIASVSVNNGTGNPYQNDISYRGFQATSVLGAPVGLTVYFDGVRLNESFGSLVNWDLIPTNAIARVVLMPGSNPVFGLNTLGGAIVLGTKNGRDHPAQAVDLKFGAYQRRALSFEGGGTANEQVDYFMAGNFDKQDGHRLHAGSDVRQLFGKVRWRGDGNQTDVQLSLTLADTQLSGTQGLPLDALRDRRSAYTWPDQTANAMGLLNLSGSHGLGAGSKLVGNAYYREARSQVVNSNAVLDDGCYAADGTLALAAGGVPRCSNQAPEGTAVNAVTGAEALALGYGRWTNAINSSLVLSSIRQRTAGSSLQWWQPGQVLGRDNAFTLGVSLDAARVNYAQDAVLARLISHEAVAVANQAYAYTANGQAPSPSNRPAFSGSPVLSQVGLRSTTQNFSLYVSDKLDLTRQLTLSGSASFNLTRIDQAGANAQFLNSDGGYAWTDPGSGVRYYNPGYAAAYRYSNTGTGAATAPNGVPAGAVAGPATNTLDGAHRYQRFNPALGYTYNPDPRFGLFGGYSVSMRAPTSVELSCADPNRPCALPTGFNGDPELKPVTARTFELGSRGVWARRVSWNVAVYDTRLKDDIQFIAASSAFGYFANVGSTERRGWEAGVQAELQGLHLALNFGHVKALYRSAFTTAAGEAVPAGRSMPGIPSLTFKLRAAYQATPQWRIGGSIVATSAQYAHGNENNSDPAGIVPGYALAHGDLHFQASPQLALSARVTNLLDKAYSTYGLSGVTSVYSLATQPFITPAPPRTIGLGLTYKWGR